MTRFFEDVGGLRRIGTGRDGSSVVLGGTLQLPDLTLIEAGGGEPEGLRSFSFEMASEEGLDKAEAGMAAAGIQPVLNEDDGTKRSIFLRDPDGFLIEFFAER